MNFKEHFLDFTKSLPAFYILVFRLYKIKVIINNNQICTRRSTQNAIGKYSRIL